MKLWTMRFAAFLTIGLVAGCGSGINITGNDFSGLFANIVGLIQTRPQELPPVLIDRGDTIIINASATVVVNPSDDIVYEELPNLTVLAFENDTDWDIYIRYYVDGELQGIYVYQGEALIIEYPCLDVVELDSEDDIDPFTGALVDSFDLTGFDYFNPDDFSCGDALILNFDPFDVTAFAEPLDF